MYVQAKREIIHCLECHYFLTHNSLTHLEFLVLLGSNFILCSNEFLVVSGTLTEQDTFIGVI